MSDPKVKPSIAARELAEKIDAEWELVPDNGYYFGDAELKQAREDTVNEAALMCQSAMTDLLEKAESLKCVFGGDAPSHGCACNNCDLAKAIEPWKTTI